MVEWLTRSAWSDLYNLNGLTDAFITVDVDWAPDFALEQLMLDLTKLGIPATIFATHPTDLLIGAGPKFEIGIHPDFTRIDKENTVKSKFETLLRYYPAALATRSHRNFFGQNTCQIASGLGLRFELSHVTFQMPYAQVFADQYGLTRASYTWEDGLHLDYGLPLEVQRVDLNSPGLKIFNLHPVLYYLNCTNDEQRKQATSGISDLTSVKVSMLASHVNSGFGMRDFSLALLSHLKSQNVKFHLVSQALNR